MTTEEQIRHLASLVILLDFHEKLGGPRNRWILAEFNECNAELLNSLKEKHRETRPGVQQSNTFENRPDLSGSQPRRSSSDWGALRHEEGD